MPCDPTFLRFFPREGCDVVLPRRYPHSRRRPNGAVQRPEGAREGCTLSDVPPLVRIARLPTACSQFQFLNYGRYGSLPHLLNNGREFKIPAECIGKLHLARRPALRLEHGRRRHKDARAPGRSTRGYRQCGPHHDAVHDRFDGVRQWWRRLRLPPPRPTVRRSLRIPGLREGDDSPSRPRSAALFEELAVPDGYRPRGSAIAA
ncbi:hypothetical protein V1281_000186 [Nitrobacteraceae bacterium AZCC 2161]